MKKRFAIMFLALVMILNISVVSVYAEEQEKGFKRGNIVMCEKTHYLHSKIANSNMKKLLKSDRRDIMELKKHPNFKYYNAKNLPCTGHNCDAEATRLPCIKHPGTYKLHGN